MQYSSTAALLDRTPQTGMTAHQQQMSAQAARGLDLTQSSFQMLLSLERLA